MAKKNIINKRSKAYLLRVDFMKNNPGAVSTCTNPQCTKTTVILDKSNPTDGFAVRSYVGSDTLHVENRCLKCMKEVAKAKRLAKNLGKNKKTTLTPLVEKSDIDKVNEAWLCNSKTCDTVNGYYRIVCRACGKPRPKIKTNIINELQMNKSMCKKFKGGK